MSLNKVKKSKSTVGGSRMVASAATRGSYGPISTKNASENQMKKYFNSNW